MCVLYSVLHGLASSESSKGRAGNRSTGVIVLQRDGVPISYLAFLCVCMHLRYVPHIPHVLRSTPYRPQVGTT